MSVVKFARTSGDVKNLKVKIFDTLAALHGDLCDLAAFERELEAERVKGLVFRDGLKHNTPELSERLEEHNKQLVLPTQKVWSLIDETISTIFQANKSAMTGNTDELPEAFESLNRLEEFTKGKR